MARPKGLKHKVLNLRAEGKSYRTIQKELQCSRGTINYHCKDNDMTDIGMKIHPLSNETKRTICPPDGNPFRNINYNYLHNEPDEENVKQCVLDILEKFINTGIDHDNKSLGAYYVLGALTLVNENAAVSLPWLYQSVSYI